MRLVAVAALGAVLLSQFPQNGSTGGRAPVRLQPARDVRVASDGDLQQALDEARPGDSIVLTPGATYRGPFRLPRKEGDGWIVVRTGASAFPPAGTRAGPWSAHLMPRLVSSTLAVLVADPGAHHYRFVGLEIAPAPGVFLTNLVVLGRDERREDAVPRTIVFERCYLHGDPAAGGRRGIALNSADTWVVDSYLSDFKEAGADSQAIAGWNGPGPFRILNNYLEAAGENVMFGGADPLIADLVPADIEIRGNHFSKPLEWREDPRGLRDARWTVKNLLELKNARRVVIDGNLFERSWPQAQNGFAILFTPKNQDGQAPWTVVEDVIFANNIVRDATGGINVLGRDEHAPSGQARNIAIRNNLFVDIGDRLFQLVHGTDEVAIEQNTAVRSGTMVTGGDDRPHTGFVFQNNIAAAGEYGIKGSGTSPGWATLERYFPGAVVRGNVIAGADARHYPPGNVFPPDLAAVGFVDLEAGDYRLDARSRYVRAGHQGGRPGVDIDALARASAAAVRETPPPPAEPLPPHEAAVFLPIPDGLPRRAASLLFWVAAFLVAYTYVGYGLLVLAVGRLRPRPVRRQAIRPKVTVLVIAYNEGARIGRKIENLLALDYPRELLEIIIASDGSTDTTAETVWAYEPRVRPVICPRRRGKPAVLNEIVPHASGEIVVLADARQMFARNAVTALVEAFADPEVGAVSGALTILREGETEAAVEGAAIYWEFEKQIRWNESRIDSTIGATGAIYAIRRELFEALPEATVLDDVVIPLRIVRRGYRVVFEPRARAYDVRATCARDELARKVRTIGGNFQLFANESWTLNPFRNRVWLQIVSHKGLRLVLPLLYAAILISNAALLEHWFYQMTMAGQVALYGAALVGFLLPAARARSKIVVLPYTVCFLSWATILGLKQFLTGRLRVTWERSGADRRRVPRPGDRRRRTNAVS